MKKALSVILAVLLLFSVVGMVGSAAGEENLKTVTFYVDGEEYYVIHVLPNELFVDRLREGLEEPVKAPTETTEYIFQHWAICDEGGANPTNITSTTGNIPAVTEDTYYVAVFAEKEIKENQSFWKFIESIFERINMIFEYFAKVFEGVFDF